MNVDRNKLNVLTLKYRQGSVGFLRKLLISVHTHFAMSSYNDFSFSQKVRS